MTLPEPGTPSNAAGFVLAGGRSSRMGTDKALLDLAGRPLLCHALDTLDAAGLPAVIAGARSDLSGYGSVIEDSGQGPLAGICAALTLTTAPLSVFVPVDMPLLPPSLLDVLLRHARMTGAPITVLSVNGFPETFPAVIHRSILPVLERELTAGRRGCFSAYETAVRESGRRMSTVPVEFLVQAGQVDHRLDLPAAFWLLNVNTPAQLAQIESLFGDPIA